MIISKEKLQVFSSVLIIALLIISFQYQSLNLGMHAEDYSNLRSYSSHDLIRSFYSDTNKLIRMMLSSYRPMFMVMYHLEYTIFGFDPYKLHLMLIVLQILQTIIAFFFFRMLTQKNTVALASVLLFPLNPNLWMHFTWNTEIPNATGMIFFLLSLVFLISYLRKPKYYIILFHFFFAILAYLTKETYYAIFFVSILTILFYRNSTYKKYLPLMIWHLIIFTTYLIARFYFLKKWGGQGLSPDQYIGIKLYAWNYVRFLGEISLFNHYISLSAGDLLIYFGITCILLIAIKYYLTLLLTLYGEVKLKLLIYLFLFVFSLQSLWLLKHINLLPELLQSKTPLNSSIGQLKTITLGSMHYKDILFLYSIVLYVVIALILVYRKKAIYIGNQYRDESSNFGEYESLIKFISYSSFTMLASSLPMFILPEGRIMNVTSLGIAGVFGSGVCIVYSMLGENSHNDSRSLGKIILRYGVVFTFILFVLNNSVMFKEKYIGPTSIYKNNMEGTVAMYVRNYHYYQKYNLRQQGAYHFNRLVSSGLVEQSTGKLMVDKIKILYPNLIENVFSESDLTAFQPTDSAIYPISK